MKLLGTIFGYNLFLDTDDENEVKEADRFLKKLIEPCSVCRQKEKEFLVKASYLIKLQTNNPQ